MFKTSSYQCIIIGGGAAGLKAAGILSKRKIKTLLIEHNSRLGKKILISGGGRCNFTNINAGADDYVGENKHFVKSALNQYTADNFIKEVKAAHIPFFEKKLGQLFCKNSAQDILDMLLKDIDNSFVDIIKNCSIQSVEKNDAVFTLYNKDGVSVQCNHLIVATGGLSFEKLGASDFGYTLAKQFGHALIKSEPALDGFKLEQNQLKRFSNLPGVSLPASIKVNQYSIFDDLLFTHQGLSGPAALKASLYWHKSDSIHINFLPKTQNFEALLLKQKKTSGNRFLKSFLKETLPNRFVENYLNLTVLNKKMAELSNEKLREITLELTQCIITPDRTIGYHKAEVTRGGISTQDISSKTMESKLCSGLYFIGEVLDVTGQLGGYNFQWAWSSAHACAFNLNAGG